MRCRTLASLCQSLPVFTSLTLQTSIVCRCFEPQHDFAIDGDLLATTNATSPLECCNSCCQHGDACEAYRHTSEGCELLNHRRRGRSAPGVVSADVAPAQLILKQTLNVFVGGGLPDGKTSLGGAVAIAETVKYLDCRAS